MAKKKNYREVLTTPFDTNIRNFSHMARYFLYYGPNIDSAQSRGRFEGKQATKVFDLMISCANMEKCYKVIKHVRVDTWKSQDLSDEVLDFETPRMIFDRYSEET